MKSYKFPTLFFFIKIALVNIGYENIHIELVCQYLQENIPGILIRIMLHIDLGRTDILTILNWYQSKNILFLAIYLGPL